MKKTMSLFVRQLSVHDKHITNEPLKRNYEFITIGSQGFPGPTGNSGTPGQQGPRGFPGTNGQDGRSGSPGPPGQAGNMGPPGFELQLSS